MPPTRTLAVFTLTEREMLHRLLAAKVARMMGRKLEEGDWAEVYCRAKAIPNRGWSNLNIDVMHEGVLALNTRCFATVPVLTFRERVERH